MEALLEHDKERKEMAKKRHFPLLSQRFTPSGLSRVISLLGITEEEANNIEVKNEKDDLFLFHYINPGSKSVNAIRGTIICFNEKEAYIVCKSLPYVHEYSFEEVEQNVEKFQNIAQQGITSYGNDGTVIRMFFRGRWFISTHKKIDASRWQGRSFKQSVSECIDLEALNKDRVYTFLLCDPLQFTILKYPVTHFIHLQTQKREGNALIECEEFIEGIEKPKITLVKELVPSLKKVPDCHSGFVTLYDGEVYRFNTPRYSYMRKIKGNVFDPFLRYVEVQRYYPEGLQDYKSIYPPGFFGNFEKRQEKLLKYLYYLYFNRYMNRNDCFLPQNIHVVITMARNRVLNTKKPQSVKMRDVVLQELQNILDKGLCCEYRSIVNQVPLN